eukprot:GHVP01038735.1.p1 GENE.GHVP01038735.1~~GHVP01038735.1.p1  ORF type:complete len:112 (+),score=15.32 GHVP01038735.1:390-725(+)
MALSGFDCGIDDVGFWILKKFLLSCSRIFCEEISFGRRILVMLSTQRSLSTLHPTVNPLYLSWKNDDLNAQNLENHLLRTTIPENEQINAMPKLRTMKISSQTGAGQYTNH